MARSFLCCILLACLGSTVTNGQVPGFLLNGASYPNGSTVLRTDIGEQDDALQCTTDRAGCCRGAGRAGEFYFPDGTVVPTLGTNPNIRTYYRSRGEGNILLHRRSIGLQTGQFRCEIPDASGRLLNLYINIVDVSISVSITTSGTNTAGETYSLQCSVTVTGSTNEPTNISWLDPVNSTVSSGMTIIVGTMSTLTLNPLAASDAGTYTCRATAGGVVQYATEDVSVQNPTIIVNTDSIVNTPVAGSVYSLNCTITGAERLTGSNITYQWFKDGELMPGETTETLTRTPLSYSDAGEYFCLATVTSSLLDGQTITIKSSAFVVELILPTPTVAITSNTTSPVSPGSDVTLTCTVKLDPAVDVPVTVTTEWLGPAGFMNITTAEQVISSNTTYSSTAMVISFARDQSGVYNCIATVNSTSYFIDISKASASTRVTVGVYLSLNGLIYSNNSKIDINDIGQTDTSVSPPPNPNNGLQCITDRVPCCNALGEWFLPDGEMVPSQINATTFYINRGDDGTVNLNRVNNDVMMPTGQFCCVVPDATSNEVTVCANIAPTISIQISDGGATPTLGQGHTLVCIVTGATFTIYQWRRDDNILTGETEETLSLGSLSLSDAGSYSCGNGTLFSDNKAITLQIPTPTSVTVDVTSNRVTIGSSVTLMCIAEMDPQILPSDLSLLEIEAQLSRDRTPLTLPDPIVTGTTFTYTILLGSFSRNDSGNYTCTVTVRPRLTLQDLIQSGERSKSVIIRAGVPPPTNVKAYQSSISGPVEVSWSPPSGGAAATITGYRIFYDGEDNILVPPLVTYIGLAISNESDVHVVGRTISIRSEADELLSELINVTITAIHPMPVDETETDQAVAVVTLSSSQLSCSAEVGIAVGVVIVVVCLFALVILVVVVLLICWWRSKKEDKNDLVDGVCEDSDKSASQEKYEMTQSPVYTSKTETAGEPVPQPTEAQSSQDEFS